MSNFFISTAALSGAARAGILAAQDDLAATQKEIATGRKADVGLEIGHRSSDLVALRQTLDLSAAIRGSNAIVATRLNASQAALGDIDTLATDFLSGLLSARSSSPAVTQVEAQAAKLLRAFTSAVNVEVAGEHVFGGLNGKAPPLSDYYAAGGSSPRATQQTAFETEFGFSSSDPAVAGIEPADMEAFIDGPFQALFDDAAWSANWSSASAETPVARVAFSETQDVGASANEAPFRQLAMALVMVSDLGGTHLNENTRAVVLGKATDLVASAIPGISSVRSRLGLAEQRIATANERLTLQADLLTNQRSEIEAADPYTTAVKLNELMQRLEASYAATMQIQRFSLLDYLR
jgi:flagellar hook-associated protein 3 FlgL